MVENDLILYTTDDGQSQLVLRELGGQVWLSQQQMAELYQTTKQNISLHVQNILDEGELAQEATVKEDLTVKTEGARQVRRRLQLYALPMIVAIGYRVRSTRGTQFRQWATRTLGEYLTKGFAMDDERLKNDGSMLGKRYFEEQLERIREIRLSERKFYQKITDIYATALDYDKSAKTTRLFFSEVQNKLHWAIHRHTAAELIVERANAEKPHMGLTSWEQYPNGKIQKYDVSIAKNYLSREELQALERIVTMYLDYAERQARRGNVMYMADWVKRLDAFLQFNEEDILHDKGKVTAAIAKAFAEKEFEKFRVLQDRSYQSDFDRLVAETSDDLTE